MVALAATPATAQLGKLKEKVKGKSGEALVSNVPAGVDKLELLCLGKIARLSVQVAQIATNHGNGGFGLQFFNNLRRLFHVLEHQRILLLFVINSSHVVQGTGTVELIA